MPVRQADDGVAAMQGQPVASHPLQFFSSLLRYRQRDSTGPAAGPLLEQAVADLEELNRATERDFLAIGGNLAEFLAAARQLSSQMGALSESISGRSANHGSQVLSRVLERSRQAESRAEAGDRALAGVCASAREIACMFRVFREIVSVFRVLASLTRIETARLGAAGAEFGSLAEEVNTLTRSIESSGQGILDDSCALHQSMQSALAKIAGLRATELQKMPVIVAEVMTSLESLDDRHRRAAEASLQQAAEYKEVSAAIEDLITALQFHDITRQQIEHVADALRRLRAVILRKAGPARSIAPANALAVLTLQSSQLTNTERIFASSAGRIESDLDSLAARVRTMAETGKALMGLSPDQQDCFLLQMEDRFTTISKIADTCARAEAEAQTTLAELTGAVGRMQDSVSQIREIEIFIRRIAINATIRAVQIGDAGAALNVIADVMQRLAGDSKRITDQTDEALDAIRGAAAGLSSGSGWLPSSRDSAADEVISEMQNTIRELHSASVSSLRCLNQITDLSARLGDDIQLVRGGFSAGTILAQGLCRARGALEQIGGLSGMASSGNHNVPAVGQLEEFAAHYTMQTEREIHESVTMAAAAPGCRPEVRTNPFTPACGSKTAIDEEDLGENVELF